MQLIGNQRTTKRQLKKPFRNWKMNGNGGRPRNLREYETMPEIPLDDELIRRRIKFGY